MSVLVTDEGFVADDWLHGFAPPEERSGNQGLDLPSDADPEALSTFVGAPAIRIDFPSFSDGRGFTLARLLRLKGFAGRLRARGHVIADQYAMARRSGFDEVEIAEELATRQPEAQWLSRANWKAHDYQTRLRG